MTLHKDMVRIRHMLDHAKEAIALTNGTKRTDLSSDRTLTLALTRLAEIVGEAAARVSPASVVSPILPKHSTRRSLAMERMSSHLMELGRSAPPSGG